MRIAFASTRMKNVVGISSSYKSDRKQVYRFVVMFSVYSEEVCFLVDKTFNKENNGIVIFRTRTAKTMYD